MSIKKHLSAVLLFVGAAFVVAACGRKKFEGKNLEATQDMALAENLFSDSFKQVAGAGQATSDSLKAYNDLLSGCGTLSITPFDTVSWPKTVILDFGNTNCVGNDGRARRGKIIGVFTYWFRSPGTVVTIGFDNYHVNDHKIMGTKTITNQGYNSANHLVYNVSFPDCQIIKPNGGGTVSWQTDRTHEWMEGENTFTPWDDVWNITGTAGGTSAQGTGFDLTVVQALNVKYGCRWIRAGILNLDIEGINTISINYGNGACDANAVATYEGQEYPFIMQ
jgi:hypothetical protein